MATRIVDEEMRFNIVINGNEAQKELFDLEKGTRRLTEENKQLTLQKKRMERENLQETEAYRTLTQTIRQNSAEIRTNKTRMSELQNQIGLTGLTMGQLISKSSQLKLLLRNLIPGSADHQRYTAELRGVTARINELNGRARQTGLSIRSIADGFNRYAALGASLIAMFTGIVFSLQKMIDYNGKLADAQSDVMKTTQMNKKEVDELTKSFGIFQTRTSRIDLLGIAEIGGRIGIAKGDVLDFVMVMDKASVALGDSFTGGAEEVAEKLGKIKFLFEETKDMGVEQAYMSIGSAINELGANGVASEANIAEFTTRIGSLTDVLKPTVAETLALGAAFEESGIEAEVSSRAYNIFMKQASTEAGKFAKVMGLSQKEVEKMINDNPLEFMLNFSKGLKGMNATDTAKTLDYLGINADGANKAIGAMANNTDRFRELLKLSNESFSEGTSLIQEYDIKNNNLAATLEKVKKAVMGWFSSDGLISFLESAVGWFGRFIGATEDVDGSGQRWRSTLLFVAKAIGIVTAAMLTSITWTKLVTVWTNRNTEANILYNLGLKARAIMEGAAIIRTQAFAIAQMLLRGNITGATQALRVMTAVMKTTPWGFTLGLIAAVTTAIILFRKNAKEIVVDLKSVSSETQILSKRNSELETSYAKSAGALKSKIEPLIRILKDQNTHLSTRKIAYQELIKISPDFIGTVDAEFMATSKLDTVYASLLDKMKQRLRAKANEKVMAGYYDDEAQAISALVKMEKDLGIIRQKAIESEERRAKLSGDDAVRELNIHSQLETEWARLYQRVLKQREVVNVAANDLSFAEKWRDSEVKRLQSELETLKEGTAKYIQVKNEILSLLGSVEESGDPSTSNYKVPVATDKSAAKKESAAAKARKKLLEQRAQDLADLKKYQEEVNVLELKAIDDHLAQMKDGFDKERALENENHNRKVADLKKQLISEADIETAGLKAESPTASKMDKAVWTHTKETWENKNKQLNQLIELEEKTHYSRLGIIVEREDQRQIKELEKKYSTEKNLREIDFNNQLKDITGVQQAKNLLINTLGFQELEAITTLDQAKKALRDKFDKEELDKQAIHLQEMVTSLENMTKSINFKGIDLNILTPEQRAEMQIQINQLKLLLSEIEAAKNGDTSGTGGLEGVSSGASMNVFGDTDILGFTAEQWQTTFNNLDTVQGKMEAVKMGVSAMQNLWTAFGNFLSANENAQLNKFTKNSDAKKRKLKWQLDNGYINQATYKKQLELLDADLEKKKMDLEYKQAKRAKTMAIVDAVINTAKGVTAALGMAPPASFIFAGIAAALGALQIATIAKQPLPAKGYEKGLYPEYVQREQDGKVFKSTYGGKTRSGMVRTPTHFLAGENGPEMIIDAQAYKDLSPNTRMALENELRNIKGFEKGYYNNDLKNPRYEVPAATAPAAAAGSLGMDAMIMALNRNSEILEKLADQGVIAYWNKDPRDLKKLQEDMDKVKSSRDKAKL